MPLKIIIPSAKSINTQNEQLRHLPPVCFPLAGRTIFDFIYDLFNEESNWFEIISYDSKELIEKNISKYRNKNIKITVLDELKDLGYSIYSAIDNSDESILINFADTIILDDISFEHGDFIFYSYEYLSNKWTFFDLEQDVIRQIIDKEDLISKLEFKFFVGFFFITNAKLFKSLLFKSFSIVSSKDSFYLALIEYSQHYNIKFIQSKKWLDFGHLDNSLLSESIIKSRTFNKVEIDFYRNKIRKTSTDKETLINEINWYLELPNELWYLTPRVFNYSVDENKLYIELEYYPYKTLHELYISGNLIFKDWIKIFHRLKNVIDDFGAFSLISDSQFSDFDDVYVKKTLNRLKLLRENPIFYNYFIQPFVINGVKYVSLDEIITIINHDLKKILSSNQNYRIIHGDFCFSNIMIDNSFSLIKLVDPRGKFGKNSIYGDYRYDLAKLLHSFDGKYDYIISDNFEIQVSTLKEYNEIDFRLNINPSDFELIECFKIVFSEDIAFNSIDELRVIESLLFFSMIPLHSDFPSRQLAMLSTAVELFSKKFDKIKIS